MEVTFDRLTLISHNLRKPLFFRAISESAKVGAWLKMLRPMHTVTPGAELSGQVYDTVSSQLGDRG